MKHRRDAWASLLSLAPTLAVLRHGPEQLMAALGPFRAHAAAAVSSSAELPGLLVVTFISV